MELNQGSSTLLGAMTLGMMASSTEQHQWQQNNC